MKLFTWIRNRTQELVSIIGYQTKAYRRRLDQERKAERTRTGAEGMIKDLFENLPHMDGSDIIELLKRTREEHGILANFPAPGIESYFHKILHTLSQATIDNQWMIVEAVRMFFWKEFQANKDRHDAFFLLMALNRNRPWDLDVRERCVHLLKEHLAWLKEERKHTSNKEYDSLLSQEVADVERLIDQWDGSFSPEPRWPKGPGPQAA